MSFADFVGGYGFSKTRTFNPISYKLPNGSQDDQIIDKYQSYDTDTFVVDLDYVLKNWRQHSNKKDTKKTVEDKHQIKINEMIKNMTEFDLGSYLHQFKENPKLKEKIDIIYHKIMVTESNRDQINKYFVDDLKKIKIPSLDLIDCMANKTKSKINAKLNEVGKSILTGSHWRYLDTISNTASAYFISIWFNLMFGYNTCVLLTSASQTSNIVWKCNSEGRRMLYFPSDLENKINKCLTNPKIKFIIISIGLYNDGCQTQSGDGHANCLVINKIDWSIMRFEPNGYGSIMDRLRHKWGFANSRTDLVKDEKISDLLSWNVESDKITSILNYDWFEQNGKYFKQYVESFLKNDQKMMPNLMIDDIKVLEKKYRFKDDIKKMVTPPTGKLYTEMDLGSEKWFDTHQLDQQLNNLFSRKFGMKYINPLATIPINSSIINYSTKKYFDPGGFCQTLTWFYLFLFLYKNNADSHPDVLMFKWIEYLNNNLKDNTSQTKVHAEEDTTKYENSTKSQIFIRNLVILMNQYYYKFISEIIDRELLRTDILIQVRENDKTKADQIIKTFVSKYPEIEYKPKNWVKKYMQPGSIGLYYTASSESLFTWISIPINTELNTINQLYKDLKSNKIIGNYSTFLDKSNIKSVLDYRRIIYSGNRSTIAKHPQFDIILNEYVIDLTHESNRLDFFQISKPIASKYLIFADYKNSKMNLYYCPINHDKSTYQISMNANDAVKISTTNYYNLKKPTDDQKIEELIRWIFIGNIKNFSLKRAIVFTTKQLKQNKTSKKGHSLQDILNECEKLT